MFRPMRRGQQALDEAACRAVLQKGTSGVLALKEGDDGYPYAVPLSYRYDGGKIYFHCAKTGHKIDAAAACSKASFCVVDQDVVVPEEYTTRYRSVIIFGTIRIMEDGEEKRAAMERLALKYAPHDEAENRRAVIDRAWPGLCVLEMTVEHMTGKESKALAAQRHKQ